MTITYQVESWSRYYSDCQELWKLHYAEFAPFHRGKLEFGPDVEMYQALERAGQLQILVARSAGVMVGYCLMVDKRHPHYTNICGFEDSYFVQREFRKGWNGIKLIKRSVELMNKRGVTVCYFMTKEFNSIALMFEWLKFRKCDTVYCTGLGE